MTTPDTGADWRKHIIEDDAGVGRVIEATRRIAVIGIKTDAGQPAYYVPEYAMRSGFAVVPVPVYYPDITEIMGQPVFRTVATIPGDVDMVNVFRRSKDVAQHVDDIIAKKPKSVWMQLGIQNDEAAEKLAHAGIDVVQDRCLMVELRRHGK
jgi:predicted CoA-binding protein